ncbi:hypothetical protein AB3R30_03060 [Leptolyngbyaceae cyanobacterium UHCC 1019]
MISITGTLLACEPIASFALQEQANIYDPNQDVMILLIANGRIKATLLHNLAIAPLDCHQQVRSLGRISTLFDVIPGTMSIFS